MYLVRWPIDFTYWFISNLIVLFMKTFLKLKKKNTWHNDVSCHNILNKNIFKYLLFLAKTKTKKQKQKQKQKTKAKQKQNKKRNKNKKQTNKQKLIDLSVTWLCYLLKHFRN